MTPVTIRHATAEDAPDMHHQGIGQALLAAMLDICDNWLPVTRTELTVFADNHAAIGLYRKMGFEQEGIARQYALRAGILTDALFMARLRPDNGYGHGTGHTATPSKTR